MDSNIAAQLLLSSDVRIAEAAKRVFTSSPMLPSLPSSSTLSAATVLRRMSDPILGDVRLAMHTIQGKEETVIISNTATEDTSPTTSLSTADVSPVPHLPVAAESSSKDEEVTKDVSTSRKEAAADGGSMMQQQQQKSSRKRVANCSTTASSVEKHASKVVSAKPASSLDSSSSPKKKKTKKSKANETNVMADMIGTVKKPLRPLSSFHLFSQIEREYIIQTTSTNNNSGAVDTDPNKSYLTDVPSRYRSIKLSSDWYAGPGKRQKRKHRKAHGVIGFQELSRLISQRWATLDTTDSKTKAFVTTIAARELEEYKLEVKEYKKLLLTLHTPTSTSPNLDDDTTCGAYDAAADNYVRLLTTSSDKVTRVVSEPENDELGMYIRYNT